MKAVILAAGYAKRLNSITNNGEIPKTLLDINVHGKKMPILVYLLDKINQIKSIDEIIIITNNKYFEQILSVCGQYRSYAPISMYSDNSTSVENATGANRAIQLANHRIPETYTDDILIMGSDNYFEFDLNEFVDTYDYLTSLSKSRINMIASKTYPDKDREFIAENFGILNVDELHRIVSLDEKPGIENLRSNIVSLAMYIINRDDLNLIDRYMIKYENDPKKRDSMGYFMSHLIKNTSAYAFEIPGRFCDIGTPQEYANLNEELKI